MRTITKLARWAGHALIFLLILILLLPTLVPPFLDRIYYRGPASGHFDGARFVNPDEGMNEWGGDPIRTTGDARGRGRTGYLVRAIMGDDRPPWPTYVPVTPAVPEPRVAGDRMVVTWVGHSTVLVQTQGLNILTDPIWSDHATPFPPLGPRRVAAPGVRFEDLPPIDLVLVSHNHYDHLDLPTLRLLWERDSPLIVTSLGNDAVIAQAGAEAAARDWGGRVAVKPGVDVIVTRNHHWGSRWFVDRNRALWSSFVVRTPGGNIFFAGDTGPGDMRWPAEAARHGPIRLALIPIGAFRFEPGQMWSGTHIGPHHAARVFEQLGAAHALAIHWRTFRLSWEEIDTPARMLREVLEARDIPADRFRAVPQGTSWEVP
ncbi:MAG: MBL fold metallo-hydrolase [Sphingomonadaceae bacterium]|nr:MBL fold metallo-hydrolase [Sphingomonadaceae bacterium]